MGGLIPLTLNPAMASEYGTYSSLPWNDFRSSLRPLEIKKKNLRTARTVSRVPQQLAPPSSHLLPGSTYEWKRCLSDIKRDYTNQKFRPCALRCEYILERITTQLHPTNENAYLIFLHFYLASALEMQVRGYHQNSSHRLEMLQNAQRHYKRAAVLATAERLVMHHRRNSRTTASSSSASHSPSSSIASVESTSTGMTSPCPSDDLSPVHTKKSGFRNTSRPQTPVKRVAFQADFDDGLIALIERPDSPTLGCETTTERFSNSHQQTSPVVSSMPNAPHSLQETIPKEPQYESSATEDDPFSMLDHCQTDPFELHDPFKLARSTQRYLETLEGLDRQLKLHLSFVDDQISSAQRPAISTSMNQDLRKLDLQIRIERLRANGWQRKRFDAQKYETLRDNAMADMMI